MRYEWIKAVRKLPVQISGVLSGSAADKAGVKAGELLLSVNGHPIGDVLDYRFYITESCVTIKTDQRTVTVKKAQYADPGLEFDTYLMDRQRDCGNRCVFCFIDQLPRGLRKSLYFKDDDERLSFLFGNYITLTNLSQADARRIVNMRISPINVSVHTTNPQLRNRMMGNAEAGESLQYLRSFAQNGIKLNCQIVLCPGLNDGAELARSLSDLKALGPAVESIAVVPVGLTKHRARLCELTPFDKKAAASVIDTVETFSDICRSETGNRLAWCADELYIYAEREIPGGEYYGGFPQLENGVGMWALFKDEFQGRLESLPESACDFKRISVATSISAAGLLREMVDIAAKKWHNLSCKVFPVPNRFFGEQVNVAGLITGQDLIRELSGLIFGDLLLLPSVMLRREGDVFLDDITPRDIEKALGVQVRVVPADGGSFAQTLFEQSVGAVVRVRPELRIK